MIAARDLPEWREREKRQLEERPLCHWCLAAGRIAVATIADRVPYGYYDGSSMMQSLCRDCHAHKWSPNEDGYQHDIGLDGMPIDPRHPWNRKPKPRPR